MKTIHWYPGHMAKAARGMEENVRLCDGVIFVLDARAPASSYNPKLAEILGKKPAVYVLNKADLAHSDSDELLSLICRSGKEAIKISALDPGSGRKLLGVLEKITSLKAEKNSEKGMNRAMRFFVAGVPNTGKSTIINLLAGGKRMQVGDKAGVTKRNQWVRCGEVELMDTPGTMPPYLLDQKLARRLAYLGCLNDDILAIDEIALCLLEELTERFFEGLFERYRIEKAEPLVQLTEICRSRGFLLKGGELDYERGERAVLDDFRKGKLGKVCLDQKEDLRAVHLTE